MLIDSSGMRSKRQMGKVLACFSPLNSPLCENRCRGERPNMMSDIHAQPKPDAVVRKEARARDEG